MSELTLQAQHRTLLGKQVRRLRREGRVPGVVYGPVVSETVTVTVDRREFDRFYRQNGHSTLFTLRWDGGEQPVFIREVQEHPIRREPLHVDFFAPNLRKPIRALVPLVLHNPNPQAEGVLTELRTEVEVEGLPAAIPHQIDADISGLAAVGDSLRVADLVMPAGITTVTGGDEVLVHLAAEMAETPEEAAAIDATEGTPAEAEAATAPSEPSSGAEVG